MIDVIMSQFASLGDLIVENYMISAVVISAVVGVITFLILTRRHNTHELPPPPKPPTGKEAEKRRMRKVFGFREKSDVPTPPMEPPAPHNERTDALMEVVRDLEHQLNRIDVSHANEEHRKWYNQMKTKIEKSKMCIHDGDMKGAQRNISGAEMYFKLIILNSV